VGENNPFGHPSQAVVEMLTSRGIKVFRTDQGGAVTVSTDGQQMTLVGIFLIW
jgi:Predicted hydrolase (metallo-beta-lactamase superfamily)